MNRGQGAQEQRLPDVLLQRPRPAPHPSQGLAMNAVVEEISAPTRATPVAASGRRLSIEIRLNGQPQRFEIEPWVTLLDLLRERAGLTGTKKGCDHGQCGACTVLVQGRRINSCLMLAVVADGAEVQTIEGLAAAGQLDPLQQAFIDRDAFQCGYCTPGQICSARGLIAEGHACTREEVRELMSGNLCRCGAYTNITDAVMDVMALEGVAR
jgi:xanthine dehydrogenase YagT iron-sulfur-binding subunit